MEQGLEEDRSIRTQGLQVDMSTGSMQGLHVNRSVQRPGLRCLRTQGAGGDQEEDLFI